MIFLATKTKKNKKTKRLQNYAMLSFILTIVLFVDSSGDSNHDLCLKLPISKMRRQLTWLGIGLVIESLLSLGSIR